MELNPSKTKPNSIIVLKKALAFQTQMPFSSHLAQISLVIVLIFGNEIDVLVFSHDLLFLLGTKCLCNLEYTNQITHANGHTFMSIISWMFCYLLSLIHSALSRYTLKKKKCTVARIMLYKNIHV